jgi:serine/threonine-protein kinase
LFPIFGLSEGTLRFVVILLAIGFPLSLVVSWAYEITPGGVKLERDVDRSAPGAERTGKVLDRAIIVLLSLVLAYFAIDKFVFDPAREEPIAQPATQADTDQATVEQQQQAVDDKSIAVLPFANLSPDKNDAYFSDGLTEELISALAKVEDLRVSARTSAFAFKGVNQDIREIGRRLNVRTVLEGSVRREQARIRVSAQLIDTEDGFPLWSESYDYELESILALQETISRAIVSALEVQLSPQVSELLEATPAVDTEAYDLYLKGRFHWARLNAGGFERSIDAFQRAIAIAPDYAPPHAGLANAYSFAGYFGLMPPSVAFPRSIEEAELALALDPASTEAMVALGMAALMYQWDWDLAGEHLRRALELAPGDVLANWAFTEYLLVLNPAQALESALYTLSLDPLSLPIMNLVAFSYLVQGKFVEATDMDKEMLSLDPRFEAAHWNLGVIYLLQERFEEAVEALGGAIEISEGLPPAVATHGYALARAGDEVGALAALAELEARRDNPAQGYASPVLIALVHEGLGRKDEAFAWLETAFEERDGWLLLMNSFPRFESLRDDPRFLDLLRRLDLPKQEPMIVID